MRQKQKQTILPRSYQDLQRGCKAYTQKSAEFFYDFDYKAAAHLVSKGWREGDLTIILCGVEKLLLTWNAPFYSRFRGGRYDPIEFEKCIRKWYKELNGYRQRNIMTIGDDDYPQIERIFKDFEVALRGVRGKRDLARVSAAKALHILAPDFFPPWDREIANKCGFYSLGSEDYAKFMRAAKGRMEEILKKYVNERGGTTEAAIAEIVRNLSPNKDFKKPPLKLIDEYCFARKKGWIE
jgi:hypothetical protein